MKGGLLWRLSSRSFITRPLLQRQCRASSSWKGSSSIASDDLNSCDREEPDEADRRLQDLSRSLKSDAFFQMLASPLRRCTVTQTVLPRALMFQLVSHRVLTSNEDQESLIAKEIERIQSEPNALLRRNSRRWIQKEAKISKRKEILRISRMLLHKIATSQTKESRQRYQGQLESMKSQLKILSKPPPKGQLLPFGLTRKSSRKSKMQGKGLWCTLNQKIVSELGNRNPHRILLATSAAPKNLAGLIQKGLEERVLEEVCLLQGKLSTLPTSETMRSGWLIRRLRGPEVRNAVHNGCIDLHYGGEASSVASLIVSGGDVHLKEEKPEVYHLDALLRDEQQREEFKQAMRAVAIILRKKAVRVQARANSRGNMGVVREHPQIGNSDEEKEPAKPASLNSGQKYPRLHVIKQNEHTVGLCIALWRLQAWNRSR